MGMESERSEEERAEKIRDRLIIFRITVTATAEKKSWPRTGNPLIAATVNNRSPPQVNPIPVSIFGSTVAIYRLIMMKYPALVTAPRSAKRIQSMRKKSGVPVLRLLHIGLVIFPAGRKKRDRSGI
jgi:hypothetical protein